MNELNSIDWALHYTVGFYYKTPQWKEKVFNYIINQLSDEEIVYARNNTYVSHIQIKNGPYIRFLPANKSSRGFRFNQIVYEQGIDDETYCMIRASVINFPMEVRIEEIND